MTQLFLILSFIFGFILGWKVLEYSVIYGIAFLMTENKSGVTVDEENNKLIIDIDTLQKFKISKNLSSK